MPISWPEYTIGLVNGTFDWITGTRGYGIDEIAAATFQGPFISSTGKYYVVIGEVKEELLEQGCKALNVWRSDDSGLSWTKVASADTTSNISGLDEERGWYCVGREAVTKVGDVVYVSLAYYTIGAWNPHDYGYGSSAERFFSFNLETEAFTEDVLPVYKYFDSWAKYLFYFGSNFVAFGRNLHPGTGDSIVTAAQYSGGVWGSPQEAVIDGDWQWSWGRTLVEIVQSSATGLLHLFFSASTTLDHVSSSTFNSYSDPNSIPVDATWGAQGSHGKGNIVSGQVLFPYSETDGEIFLASAADEASPTWSRESVATSEYGVATPTYGHTIIASIDGSSNVWIFWADSQGTTESSGYGWVTAKLSGTWQTALQITEDQDEIGSWHIVYYGSAWRIMIGSSIAAYYFKLLPTVTVPVGSIVFEEYGVRLGLGPEEAWYYAY